MEDKIYILDGSKRLHIENTLGVLREIEAIRGRPQSIFKSFDREFLSGYLARSMNRSRNQIEIEELMAQLSINEHLHRDNSDRLKVILFDQDMYSSRQNTNFGFGVTFPYDNLNKYVLISTARLQDETHAKHVLAHEIGHAFGAPSNSRADAYESLGMHCGNRNCTMHQELNGESSYHQALRIAQAGKRYCNICEEDIRNTERRVR